MVALYDWTKEDDDELTFTEGDFIYVTSNSHKGWHEGVCNGKKGLFPANYVEKVEVRGKQASLPIKSPETTMMVSGSGL